MSYFLEVITLIIIVSGLPRSGTSMMMRMLEQAGVPILTDNLRQPDMDNLLGYYEYEPVKNLTKDNSWLGKAKGKAVKIVSPLLKSITPDHRYKVIFMERKIDEVLASQRKMMKRRRVKDGVHDDKMKAHYINHLEDIKKWLKLQPHMETLYVDYNEVLDDPIPWVLKVQEFLCLRNAARSMAEVVKPELYRQRT